MNKIGEWKRLWLGSTVVVAMLATSVQHTEAQVIPTRDLTQPRNAQQVLDPTPLPLLTDPDQREPVDPEDTPVRTRHRPEYEPRGIRAGAWMFNPTLTAGSLYDSNVFSSNTDPQADIAAVLGAGLRAHTLWERHSIDLQALTESRFYRDHPGLNRTDVTLKGTGRFDVDHATALLAAFQVANLHEDVGTLSSPAGAVEPTPYSLFSGDVTARREFGRFTASFGERVDSYTFGSTRAADGSVIDQSARDGQVYTTHGRVDYAFSEKLGVFTAAEFNSRRLRGSPTSSLDSDGYRALIGFDLELTHLIRGEIAGGYMAQRFTNAAIGTVQGPAYRAMLIWSPSRRTDVSLNVEQMVTEASDTSVTGILANAVQLGVDYELRPNVILSTSATYEKDNFKGVDRSDNVYFVDTQLKYLMNNVSSISLYYRYTLRDSSLSNLNFDKHQVGINAAAHF